MKTRFYTVEIDSGIHTCLSDVDDLSAAFPTLAEARESARSAVEIGGEEEARVVRHDVEGAPARLLADAWLHMSGLGTLVETWVRGRKIYDADDLPGAGEYTARRIRP